MAIQPTDDVQQDDPTAPTQQIKQPTAPVAANPTAPTSPTPVAPTSTSPLPISGILGTLGQTLGQAGQTSSDPMAFASQPTPLSGISSMLGGTPSTGAPSGAGGILGSMSSMLGGTPSTAPTAPAPAITPAGAPTTSYSSPGTQWTGTYDPTVDANGGYMVNPGDGSYEQAKTQYQVNQLQQAGAKNIQYNPYTRAYVDADKTPIGDAASNFSAADQQALQARIAQVMGDPSSTAAAKALVQTPGYGTPQFDQSLNNGTNPGLAAQVQQLLGQSSAQHVATPAPSGYDALVGGQHYSDADSAAKALQALQAPATPARSLTPGAANDAGTPSSGVGASSFPTALSAIGAAPGASAGAAPNSTQPTPSASGAGGAGGSGGSAVSLTPTDPSNPLTSQTIAPGAGLDRFKIAQDQYNAAKAASEPGYQSDLDTANRNAFGAGRGVSGMLRTTRGNIESDRQNTLAKQQSDLLSNALLGTVDDGRFATGVAQQQQGFQNTQQQQAFSNAIQQALANESLTNGAFGRAQAQEGAGYSNDPSNIALLLSQIFGSQATGAGQSASQLFQQAGQSGQPNAIDQYIQQLLGGQAGSNGSSGSPPPAMGQ